MPVLQVLRWALLAAELYISLPIVYLVVLVCGATVQTRRRQAAARVPAPEPATRFAVLIPAHNEEGVLGALLGSLATVDYPRALYSVFVVADNCTDGTAELVRATGWAHVYERSDASRKGKGYALEWLLAHLNADHLIFDAYIVLDADGIVEPAFLRSLARELEQGARACQANNTVLNISDSPTTGLRWIALSLVNHVRTLGRNGIGGSSTLTGNGMCLSRAVLDAYPWQSYGLAEDYQYYLRLVSNGERVRYVPEAVARSQMPTSFKQLRTQDIRWESLGPDQKGYTRRTALTLLREGLRRRDLVRLDAFAELVTPPLSFMAASCVVTLGAALALTSPPEIIFAVLLVVGLLVYVGSALYLLRPPRPVYIALLFAPRFMLSKLWVYLVLRGSAKHTSTWVRTSRVTIK